MNTRVTRSHYWEHTRQQDGWTVLAPLPGTEPTELPPPPYTEEATAEAASSAPAATAAVAPEITLCFELPTNTNIIGAAVVTRTKNYGRNVPFSVAYPEICCVMGLDPLTARLGYKWDNDRVNTAIRDTEKPTGDLYNQEPAPAAKGTKRKLDSASSSSSGRRTFDFTKEYFNNKELMKKRNARFAGDKTYEFTLPQEGDGQEDDGDISYNAVKGATIRSESSLTSAGRIAEELDRDDNDAVEEQRLATSRMLMDITSHFGRKKFPRPTVEAPTIHVTVNTGTGGSSSVTSPPHRSPLAAITAASANAGNIDVPTSLYRSSSDIFDENGGSDAISYPPVTEILQLIDNSRIFEDSVTLTFPAVVFVDGLQEFQITHVDQVPLLSSEFFVEQMGMPAELAELFVEESIAAMGRAQKGKGKRADVRSTNPIMNWSKMSSHTSGGSDIPYINPGSF
ncbi:hypothetical protein C8J57DRAFT_1241756 [Mycena rebaudengoi]|nr:hypothetical protein C8J57DRAFT_1241756 [Mycena rebaudengoi]